MNSDIKKEWIEALTSGKYQQGESFLRKRRTNGTYVYCCLGVLCDIYNKKGMGEWSRDINGESEFYLYKNVYVKSYLPESLAIEADLSSEKQEELAQMNDIGGYSFVQIANCIEEEL